MTYGTSHLLIGAGYFGGGGGGKKKYCCVRGNKNIGDVFYQLHLISKKGPNAKNKKCAKKCKKLSNIEKVFLARFAHSAFNKIYISGAAYRHAPVQYAKYVFFLFLFFFLSSHHDTNPLLHLYHFHK